LRGAQNHTAPTLSPAENYLTSKRAVPRAVYPHQLQCDVLVWGYWYGKSRVFQTGELVVDEFAVALGVPAIVA